VVLGDLAGTEQERLLVVVTVVAVGHDLARRDRLVVLGLIGRRAAEHLLELPDASLVGALLVLGRVVAAVLLQVALVASRADPIDDLGAQGATPLLELGIEPVEGLLGQPDHAELLERRVDTRLCRVGDGCATGWDYVVLVASSWRGQKR